MHVAEIEASWICTRPERARGSKWTTGCERNMHPEMSRHYKAHVPHDVNVGKGFILLWFISSKCSELLQGTRKSKISRSRHPIGSAKTTRVHIFSPHAVRQYGAHALYLLLSVELVEILGSLQFKPEVRRCGLLKVEQAGSANNLLHISAFAKMNNMHKRSQNSLFR